MHQSFYAKVTNPDISVLGLAAYNGFKVTVLDLLCLGAHIDALAVSEDKTEGKILGKIEERIKLLCDGKRITALYSKEEGIFMWNLAFISVSKYQAAGRRVFSVIRSFITFNGIFMAPGFDLGEGSLWYESGGVVRRHCQGL